MKDVQSIYSRDELVMVILPVLRKYCAEKAILFGSCARQEPTGGSDIDILVIGGDHLDPTDVFCIADELYRKLDKNVDVYELREINEGSEFYRAIFSEGVQIA